METLQKNGVEVYMMSGDKEEAAKYWAEKAGIKHYQSKVLPQDKENLVRTFTSRRKTCCNGWRWYKRLRRHWLWQMLALL